MSLLTIFMEEGTTNLSFGRVFSAAIIVGCLLASGIAVYKTGHFPDMPTAYATLAGALYGINKFATKVGG